MNDELSGDVAGVDAVLTREGQAWRAGHEVGAPVFPSRDQHAGRSRRRARSLLGIAASIAVIIALVLAVVAYRDDPNRARQPSTDATSCTGAFRPARVSVTDQDGGGASIAVVMTNSYTAACVISRRAPIVSVVSPTGDVLGTSATTTADLLQPLTFAVASGEAVEVSLTWVATCPPLPVGDYGLRVELSADSAPVTSTLIHLNSFTPPACTADSDRRVLLQVLPPVLPTDVNQSTSHTTPSLQPRTPPSFPPTTP